MVDFFCGDTEDSREESKAQSFNKTFNLPYDIKRTFIIGLISLDSSGTNFAAEMDQRPSSLPRQKHASLEVGHMVTSGSLLDLVGVQR